jgi:hypothetical protein
MTISERVLIKWRKETLQLNERMKNNPTAQSTLSIEQQAILHYRMLELTQELIDQQLLKEAKDATISR